jgi:hypothetical protein
MNVLHLLSHEFLILTKQGLDELTELLSDRTNNYFRNKKVPIDPYNKKIELPTDKFKFDFDYNKELKIHSPVLRGSYKEIEQHYQNPEILIKQITEKRELAAKEKLQAKEDAKRRLQEAIYDDDAVIARRRRQLQREKNERLLKEKNKKKMEVKREQARVQQAKKK